MGENNEKEITMPRNREVWIDVLKGIAIILVVIGHNANETIESFIFCFHMPLFFMISGYLFSPKPAKKYLTRSVKRLIVPYVAFLILIGTPLLAAYYLNGKFGSEGIVVIKQMIYGGRNLTWIFGTFWFITVLWMATNLFNFMLSYKVSVWFLPLLILVGYLTQFIPCSLPWNIDVVPMALSFIWIGFLLKKSVMPIVKSSFKGKWILYTLSAVLILGIVFIFREALKVNMKYGEYGMYFISILSSVLASVSVAVFAIILGCNKLTQRLLMLIGGGSMVIMYLHFPVKFLIFDKFGMENNYILCILGGILISIAAYWLMKRYMITRRIFLGE